MIKAKLQNLTANNQGNFLNFKIEDAFNPNFTGDYVILADSEMAELIEKKREMFKQMDSDNKNLMTENVELHNESNKRIEYLKEEHSEKIKQIDHLHSIEIEKFKRAGHPENVEGVKTLVDQIEELKEKVGAYEEENNHLHKTLADMIKGNNESLRNSVNINTQKLTLNDAGIGLSAINQHQSKRIDELSKALLLMREYAKNYSKLIDNIFNTACENG